MMRVDALNSHVYPVRTEMTGTKQIIISYVCYTEKSKQEEFLVDKTSPQIYSTDKDESKIIIFHEISMEESESECVHKNTNKEKDAKNEAEYEEPIFAYDPVVKEPRYFNIFEWGKNILNSLDATYEQACMATPRDKYYTKIYGTIVY